MLRNSLLAAVMCSAVVITAAAQTSSSSDSTNPPDEQTQEQTPDQQQQIQVTPMNQTPVYRVQVVERAIDAVDYRHRASSSIKMQGTDLDPKITGEAKIDSNNGRISIHSKLEHMQKPEAYGPQFLTYVLWAVTPEGRATNLGEVLPNDDGNAELNVTTNLQAFGLIVTAEPYFAVTAPSDLIVADNLISKKTQGWAQPIHTKFEAMNRREYTVDIPASELPATTADRKKVPLELLQARNAIAIAKASGAQQYAPDALQRANDFLAKGEDYLHRDQGKGPIGTVARYAAQQAEDARVLTIRRKEQEQAENQRMEMQQRTEEARQRAQAEADRAREAQEQREQAQQQLTEAQQQQQAAEQARQQAEQAAQQAAQERAAAEQARQQALQEQQNLKMQMQQAQAQAQQAQSAAQRAEMEREQTRQRLLTQLNQVLQTKDTARGLIVNMSDVLFDFNKATLKPGARERLARVAGILLAYPDLHLQIEGHTDNIGSDSYNMQLSDRRAETVRDYLVNQGVPAQNVASRGLGKSDPVASNDTAAGRQMNRRVELVVSGQSIQANTQTPGGPAGTPGTSATGTTENRTYTNQSYGSTSSTTNTTQPVAPAAQPMTSQPATSPNEPVTQPATTQPMNSPQQTVPSSPASAPPTPPR